MRELNFIEKGKLEWREAADPQLDGDVAEGRLSPEQVTGETASWNDAAEAVASHRSKLVISR